MLKIDSHQHFWKFDPIRDSWINDDMKVIQRDFMPLDLKPVLKQNNFEGCVVVQSDQTEAENGFQLANAEQNDFIKSVVGWVDLQADNIEERLDHYSQYKKLKGFRHVLQGERDRALMLKPAFMHGIKALQKHGFTYDILIFPDQLPYISEFVKAFPDQKFVIDHIAKPNIKEQKIDDWQKGIQAVASFSNVWCKVSGMVTEADWKNWKTTDFKPYLDIVTEAFGIQRLMFGSDWPVCLVAADYMRMTEIATDYFSMFSKTEQIQFWRENAIKFYGLTV